MARRIVVVLSQSPIGRPERRHLEEELVTQLLMQPGIEANVVGHLPDLDADGTGWLCLQSVAGDMIVLGWLDRADMAALLNEHNVPGRLGRTRYDPDVADGQADTATATARAIYYLDLRRFNDVAPLIEEVKRIREDLSVVTTQLAGLMPAPDPTAKRPATDVPQPAAPMSVPPPVATEPPQGATTAATEDAALDRLVEQLDELDI